MTKAVIGIIGTAGRGSDAVRLDGPTYDAMYAETLTAVSDWKAAAAVSGMAAWADHLAVRAFLDGKVRELFLFAPAEWAGNAFTPNPKIQFNPGKRLNDLHRQFSSAAGIDSLSEMAEAVRRGAVISVHPGFDRRNLEVAGKATHLIAFTFGGEEPSRDLAPDARGFSDSREAGVKDGGTARTWGQAWRCEMKRHVNIQHLKDSLADTYAGP